MLGMSNAKLVCSQVRTANAMATSTPIATRCFTEYFAHGESYAFDLDGTLGDAYRYGVRFLQETGYFNRRQRFCTDQDFPESKLYGTISKPS
jgi:hypothetical protein